MHTKEAKGILSQRNGMNIYRGCTHGCIYCDSRSTCYQINHVFEDIEVKINAPQLLETKLRSKRKKCMISTGAMSDPYVKLPKEYNITRKCFEIINKYQYGLSVLTKSTDVLNDIDIFKSINEHSKCVVQMTLTTFDEKLCKIIEPNVSSTFERYKALCELRDNDIPTVVWLDPFLPYINDTIDNIKGLMNYCIDAKVKGIVCFGIGLTLREGNREYFYNKLDEHFPGMKERYITEFGNNYMVNSPNHNEIMKYIKRKCKENNIICSTDAVFDYLSTYESKYEYKQLSLF